MPLALLPVAAAIALSASRGALLLGVPAAVIVVLLTGGGRWRSIGFGLIGLMALGLAMLLSGAAAPFVAGTRFENALDLTRGTGFFRAYLWQSAVRMWQDHPWLGVGPDNFLYAYRGRYILPAAWQEPGLSHPHNIVLDFASRLGCWGLSPAPGWWPGSSSRSGAAWAGSAARARALWVVGVGLAGLLAAVLAHGLVDHSFFLVDLAFVFMLACGLAAQLARQAAQETPS